MTTYNLNIAKISFRSSLDSRDIQKEIDNIEGLKNDYESDLETLNDELNELGMELFDIENKEDYEDKKNDIDSKLEEIADKENEIQECEFEYNSYSKEFAELESLKEEIVSKEDDKQHWLDCEYENLSEDDKLHYECEAEYIEQKWLDYVTNNACLYNDDYACLSF